MLKNIKFFSTILVFLVGVAANWILSNTGIEVPTEVQTAFVALIIAYLGRYSRLWETDSTGYVVRKVDKTPDPYEP